MYLSNSLEEHLVIRNSYTPAKESTGCDHFGWLCKSGSAKCSRLIKSHKKRNMFCNDDQIIYSKIAKLFHIVVYLRHSVFLANHEAWQWMLPEDNKWKADNVSSKISRSPLALDILWKVRVPRIQYIAREWIIGECFYSTKIPKNGYSSLILWC